MSVEKIECKTAAEAFDKLLGLAQEPHHEVFFRGVRDETWDLGSTYSRHTSMPHSAWNLDLESMIDHFINGVISTGKTLPFEITNRRAKLEYARHYGLPTPLIDWSFSPYVAAFFAFDGVRERMSGRSVVYALSVEGIADLFAAAVTANLDGSKGPNYSDEYNKFREPLDFTTSYPGPELRFMDYPASWNVRMTRQMGAFLYDTLDYTNMGVSGLEEFIEKGKEITSPHPLATLTKIYIPHNVCRGVFERLELAGITGTRLMDDYEGAVADARNAYNYNRKWGYFWNHL